MPLVAVNWFALSAMVLGGLLASGCSAKTPAVSQVTVSTVVLKPIYPPKPYNSDLPVYKRGENPAHQIVEIGRLSVKALELEAGIDSIKDKARLLGADAIIELTYKRHFHHEYARSLYAIDGVAVVWKQL